MASTGAFEFGPRGGTADLRDGAVTIRGAGGAGRGALVGRRKLLTVQHVVGDASSVEVGLGYLWATARVVRTIPAWPEALVELELSAGDAVEEDRVLETRSGKAAWVLCADGPRAWGQALRSGDSGSPVIDATGAVVGLVVGDFDQQPLLAIGGLTESAGVASLR